MSRYHILYNPLAGNGACRTFLTKQKKEYPGRYQHDITKITDYEAFFQMLREDDIIILCGGDGTLNQFANKIQKLNLPNPIYYYPTGTGNDFIRDIEPEFRGDLYRIDPYLKDLPIVTVNGQEQVFLNAVGYGIDGYCSKTGDMLRERSSKKVNYTSIAIKGLLHDYKPTNALVTVDGQTHAYSNVWLAPTMHGRYYGGGMMAAPNQSRTEPDKRLSLVVMHDAGKLKTLCVFPSIFKGEHVKHTEMVEILCGQEITVTFDRPTPLQIDGETIPNVLHYEACVSPKREPI